MAQTVSDLEQKIREQINKPRLKSKLIKDNEKWNYICSALDAIGDAETAIYDYLKNPDVTEIGIRYLLTYGLLQILYVEQNAVITLRKTFELSRALPSGITEIRDLRDAAVGHPTTNGGGGHFIARITLSKKGFSLLSAYPDRNVRREVNLIELISTQQGLLANSLSEVLEKILNDEKTHKLKFSNDRLGSLFPANIEYYFQKIHEGISDQTGLRAGVADASVSSIRQIFDNFISGITARELDSTVDNIIQEISYPLSEIEKFFFSASDRLPEQAIRIFTDDLERKFEHLEEIAHDIDRDYQSIL